MTIGIYALYWEGDDSIYIGQAQDLSNREKEHLRDLRSIKHSNYKVQQKYNELGIPQFIILDHCSIQELNEREILWQKEFNSLESLDIVYAGQVGYGHNSNNSKYTKRQILSVFKYLYKSPYLAHKVIANNTNTTPCLVDDISSGATHKWLQDRYPYLYSCMVKKRKSYRSRGIEKFGKDIPKVKSPTGEVFDIVNIKEFAIQHNLADSHFGDVIRGKRKQHKGWVLM